MKDFTKLFKYTNIALDKLTKKDFRFNYDDLECSLDADFKKVVDIDETTHFVFSISVEGFDDHLKVSPMMYVDFVAPYNEGLIIKVKENRYTLMDEDAIEIPFDEDSPFKDKVSSYLNEINLGKDGLNMLKDIALYPNDVTVRVGCDYHLTKRQSKVFVDFYNAIKDLGIESQDDLDDYDVIQFTNFNK